MRDNVSHGPAAAGDLFCEGLRVMKTKRAFTLIERFRPAFTTAR
jgi:hypothetical protein